MPDTVACSDERVIIDYYFSQQLQNSKWPFTNYHQCTILSYKNVLRFSFLSKKTKFPFYLLLLNIGQRVLTSATDKKEKRYGINRRERQSYYLQIMKLSLQITKDNKIIELIELKGLERYIWSKLTECNYFSIDIITRQKIKLKKEIPHSQQQQ